MTLVTASHRSDDVAARRGKCGSNARRVVRVAKPGGRVVVMVLALDIPWVVNVPLRAEVKSKARAPRGFVGAHRCADASLYRRFHQTGLTHVQMWPHFAAFEQPHTVAGTVCVRRYSQCPHRRGNAGVARGHSAPWWMEPILLRSRFTAPWEQNPRRCAQGNRSARAEPNKGRSIWERSTK